VTSSESLAVPLRSASDSSMTTDCSMRLAPRCTLMTVPAPGAVWSTPGHLRSSKSTWPRLTVSPSTTHDVDGSALHGNVETLRDYVECHRVLVCSCPVYGTAVRFWVSRHAQFDRNTHAVFPRRSVNRRMSRSFSSEGRSCGVQLPSGGPIGLEIRGRPPLLTTPTVRMQAFFWTIPGEFWRSRESVSSAFPGVHPSHRPFLWW